jgi:hypothetical protein
MTAIDDLPPIPPVDPVLLERVSNIYADTAEATEDDDESVPIDLGYLLTAVQEELRTRAEETVALARRYIAFTNTLADRPDLVQRCNATPEALHKAYRIAAHLPVQTSLVGPDALDDHFDATDFDRALASS